jgi:hypothetical protein
MYLELLKLNPTSINSFRDMHDSRRHNKTVDWRVAMLSNAIDEEWFELMRYLIAHDVIDLNQTFVVSLCI